MQIVGDQVESHQHLFIDCTAVQQIRHVMATKLTNEPAISLFQELLRVAKIANKKTLAAQTYTGRLE